MSLGDSSDSYSMARGEGEALWFNGGLGLLKATTDLTGGRFAALELLAPKDFASPLHIHHVEDEFFVVLSGEIRLRHGEDIVEATEGSLVYGPRDVPHAFRVDSDEARLLLFFSPGGVEGFFREGGKPAARGQPAATRRGVRRPGDPDGDRRPLSARVRRATTAPEGISEGHAAQSLGARTTAAPRTGPRSASSCRHDYLPWKARCATVPARKSRRVPPVR